MTQHGEYYKLKRTTQEKTLRYNSPEEMTVALHQSEIADWRENELYLIARLRTDLGLNNDSLDALSYAYQTYEPSPEKPQEIKIGKNLFDTSKVFTPGFTLNGTETWATTSTISGLTINDLTDKKEENEMKILDIYKERKNMEIKNNFYKKKMEIIQNDAIQTIIIEMEKQINTILDNEERTDRFGISKHNEELLTKESKEKMDKLEAETDMEKDKLFNNIEEVKALFEMTEDYTERMKILKRYDIITKQGKLSV